MGTGGGRGRAGSSPKCSWEKTTVKSCITLVCTVILDNGRGMGEGWAQGGHFRARAQGGAGGIIAKVFLGKNYGQIMYHTCLYGHFRQMDDWARMGEGWAQGEGEGGRDHRQSVPGKKLRSNHVSHLSVRSF